MQPAAFFQGAVMQFDLTRMSGQVAHMNNLFGNPKGDRNNIDWEVAQRQLKLIEHELEELKAAVTSRDVRGLRDGACDVLVTTLGLTHRTGFNVEMDMVAVYLSNMSKFCKDSDELERTIIKYHNLGVQVVVEGEFPFRYVKAAHDHVDKDGNKYAKGKFLKGINFKEPEFAP
jgi:hypothetical protein